MLGAVLPIPAYLEPRRRRLGEGSSEEEDVVILSQDKIRWRVLVPSCALHSKCSGDGVPAVTLAAAQYNCRYIAAVLQRVTQGGASLPVLSQNSGPR